MKEKPYLEFKPGEEAAEILFNWWKMLNEADKSGRAQLKRCATIEEIVFIQVYHVLLHKLQIGYRVNRERLAAMAGIIAHIKFDSPEIAVAKLFAAPKTGGKAARLKGLRFRKLLKNKSHEDLFSDLRKGLKIIDSTANVVGLANDVYRWNDYVKKQWAFDYYSVAPEEK